MLQSMLQPTKTHTSVDSVALAGTDTRCLYEQKGTVLCCIRTGPVHRRCRVLHLIDPERRAAVLDVLRRREQLTA